MSIFNPSRIASLSEVLPESVCHSTIHGYPENDFCIFPGETELLSKQASTKRKKEFSAGRHAAHNALQKLTGEIKPVLRGSLGEPQFPEGITGSITHTQSLTIAVAAQRKDLRSIGIDCEALNTVNTDIASRVARENELNWLREVKEEETLRLLALFSAKEALYKLLAPECGKKFWYQDACLDWNGDKECFTATLRTSLSSEFEAGYVVAVNCSIYEHAVFTSSVLV